MWSSLSNAIANFGLKKNSTEPSRATLLEISDDEICSDSSTDEGLECPICWESFNIVENVPYVLWCGHTLCHNCVLGLPWASLKFSSQQIQVPLFISCPWCHILTLRLVYKGNMKFPRKNFFLLWMVESLNGDRMRSPPSSICGDHQSICSLRSTSALGNQSINSNHRRAQAHRVENAGSSNTDTRNGLNQERPHISLHKSLDFFLQFTAKFPLVLVLLAIIIFVIPASAAILGLYLLITVLFALPSFLVLYFAYPALDWLAREIAT